MVHVTFSYFPVINFAMQQNRVSFIRELLVENHSDKTLEGLNLVVTTEPDFGKSAPFVIEHLPPGEKLKVDPAVLSLSATAFAQLTERMAAQVSIEVNDGQDRLLHQSYPVDILAYDQWGGISVLPEMLSAFITPNHPAIVPILKRAALILEQWTGSASFDEYQSRNPDRVRKQMAAIYLAIAELQIIYSTVPASFEAYGQRIRMVDTVLSQQLGTCLDMTLLYASCLEAVGIHPLVVVTSGHAFAGAWLIPDTFPDAVVDDLAFLTKRTALGIHEIALVETTCMNMGQAVDFDAAVKLADGKLNDPAAFVLAIDVKRTRFSGIRPIPQRILNGLQWEIVENKTEEETSYASPQHITAYDLSGIDEEITVTKQLLWERKLLDLSLRNNLLNIRMTKNTLQLMSADLYLLEDALADGSEFQILSKPADWDNPLYQFGLYRSPAANDPVDALVKSELSQNRLRTHLEEGELQKALTHLYRSSRTAMEENGANTLYIALGLLEWYETASSERPRYAPILLLPVEMVRKSAGKGYIVRSREEEAMLNITLLEMLRQNFGLSIKGLDPLPSDEKGVNVELIFSILRNAIKNQRKWDVKEQSILGIFSFNKFIMWNDIHNNADKLAANKIVSSLMNGKIEWEPEEETADAALLDKELSPAEIVLPIGADSSQLEAIYEANNGKTFILHGPPGTGKSQTITNIIANALYRGKRVLFVAEKMAALSVVKNRLSALGLSPFCLELYSNKTKKTAVLSQLKAASEVLKSRSATDFKAEADRLFLLRKEINRYAETLHKQYPFGLSLYDAITNYMVSEEEGRVEVPRSFLEELTPKKMEEVQELLDQLVSVGMACGHPHAHPLTGMDIPEYKASLREEAVALFREAGECLERLKEQSDFLVALLGKGEERSDRSQLEILTGIAGKLLEMDNLSPALLLTPSLQQALDDYRLLLPSGRKRDDLKQAVLSVLDESSLSIASPRLLLNQWNELNNKWLLPRFFGQRKISRQLQPYSLRGKLPGTEVKNLLEQIIAYQEEVQQLSKKGIADFPSLFGRFGKPAEEDWAVIERIIDDASVLNGLLFRYTKDAEKNREVKEKLAAQLQEGLSSFREIHGAKLREFNRLSKLLLDIEQGFSSLLGVRPAALYAGSGTWIEQTMARLKQWEVHLDGLKDWCRWLSVRRELENRELAFVVEAYVQKPIETSRIKAAFLKGFHQAVIVHILAQESQLELFKGQLFDDVITRFRSLVADFERLTRGEIYARLAASVPDFTREATQSSEVGILQRNIRNNGRGTSIRRLFDQVPILLSRLCPCMLMSPISVAQYIDPEAEKFDLVIFDEASQMPTYEAVGAIARGTNVVVVGDPKQMPPTNFFAVNTVDEDLPEMEDLESILDDCLALSVPSKYLLWHYRSKHESLIAFSNSEYYDNKLLTFPSPDNIESKVRFIPIQGYYDKGKSRQNETEARAVVDEIVRRLRDPELRKKSIGVVTFSLVQQSLIEDLLSDVFIYYPDLEALALEGEEPVFIKNLENVQGDERDVILFSVGYGPDKDGKVSMNFGPLNREGGERRLNVAVSRARYEMMIFSTLRSDHIDLNRTSSIGVAGLKRFLEYAERGEKIRQERLLVPTEAPAIESLIAKELTSLGYTVHTHIGSSGYRIDIGIVDKNNPSNYLLGILCDGENYLRAKTTRDREVVQTQVLNLLGWNMLRVWTMDWWENKQGVIDTIQDRIKEIEDRETKCPEPEVPVNSLPEEAKKSEVVFEKPLIGFIANEPKPKVSSRKIPYEEARLSKSDFPAESFFWKEKQNLLLKQIKEVVSKEAPVSRSLLCKRILSAWGISRLGIRLDTYLESLFSELGLYAVRYDELTFFWLNKEQYDTYDRYRIRSGRDAVDLPPEEVANAMKDILSNEISLPASDLSRLTANVFGFSRSGTHVDAAMSRGIATASEKGYLRVDNGRAIIC